MDEHITISTPEQVAIQYEVAGIGSRFVASLLDHLILGLALTLIWCGGIALGISAFALDESGAGFYLLLSLIVLVVFLLFWGYFVIFETLWNGQTPGKRAGGLRVIRRSGQPVGAGEVMVRNLVRLIDLMPGFYGIGLISMFADKESRRLGDFAAGTIVIREGEDIRLRNVRVPEPSLPASSVFLPTYGTTEPQTPISPPTRPDPLPGVSLRDVTHEDLRLIRELLARVHRREIGWERGQELATRMAYAVSSRMGHDFREWQQRGWEPLVFLESLLGAKDARGE